MPSVSLYKRFSSKMLFATATTLMLAVTACSSSGSESPSAEDPAGDGSLRPVKFVDAGLSAISWGLLVADAKGFFKKHGIDYEFTQTQSSSAAVQAIISGSANMGSSGVIDTVRPALQDAPISIIATGVAHPPFTIEVTEDIGSWGDLRGKTVTVDAPQGLGRFFFDEGAKMNGLDLATVEFVYVGTTPNRYAALKSGSVAAAMLSPPFSEKAASDGYKQLAVVAEYLPDAPFQTIAVNRNWAEKHQDEVVGMLRALMEASVWLNNEENRDEAAKILADATSTSMDDSLASYDFYVGKIKGFKEVPKVETEELDAFLEAANRTGVLDVSLKKSATFVDSTYLEMATGAR